MAGIPNRTVPDGYASPNINAASPAQRLNDATHVEHKKPPSLLGFFQKAVPTIVFQNKGHSHALSVEPSTDVLSPPASVHFDFTESKDDFVALGATRNNVPSSRHPVTGTLGPGNDVLLLRANGIALNTPIQLSGGPGTNILGYTGNPSALSNLKLDNFQSQHNLNTSGGVQACYQAVYTHYQGEAKEQILKALKTTYHQMTGQELPSGK